MEKSFYTGKGIGVCILDTGIYEHIDFTGRIDVDARQDLAHLVGVGVSLLTFFERNRGKGERGTDEHDKDENIYNGV